MKSSAVCDPRARREASQEPPPLSRAGLGRTLLLVSGALLAATAIGCSKEAPSAPGGGKRGPVPVTVAKAEQRDVPVELRALGTVEPIQSTPIRAQIGGTIMEVSFREGDLVKAGQLLFQIDPRPYEATLKQLEADLARLEAQVRNAEAQVRNAEAQVRNAEAQQANADSQVKRYEELVQKDFVTREQYDQRRTNADAAKAAVDASRATLDASRAGAQAAKDATQGVRASIENARLQLGYTTIRSPVSGQTGSLLANQGDLVKANDTQLVVVNQLEPILARFAVPERSLPDVQKYRKQGSLRVRVTPPGGTKPREGRLVFVDNAVDPATATIALKAEFQNGDHALWPGQFLDVILVLYTRPKAVVVPSQAIQTGQQGPYVFVVDAAGASVIRPVEPGIVAEERTVVEKGVAPGETVVTDGQLRLTPGAKVVIKEGLGQGGEPQAGTSPAAAEPVKGRDAPAGSVAAGRHPDRPAGTGKTP